MLGLGQIFLKNSDLCDKIFDNKTISLAVILAIVTFPPHQLAPQSRTKRHEKAAQLRGFCRVIAPLRGQVAVQPPMAPR